MYFPRAKRISSNICTRKYKKMSICLETCILLISIYFRNSIVPCRSVYSFPTHATKWKFRCQKVIRLYYSRQDICRIFSFLSSIRMVVPELENNNLLVLTNNVIIIDKCGEQNKFQRFSLCMRFVFLYCIDGVIINIW